MSFRLSGWRLRLAFVTTAVLAVGLPSESSADRLAEFLFWHEMGKAAGKAARSYSDYQSERQLWREKIAAAKRELERCGGCGAAQAELDKWQRVENEFHDFAGGVFVAVGMPPIVAQALGIRMPLAPRRSQEERAKECQIVRQPWVSQRSGLCQQRVDQYLNCLRSYESRAGVCTADAAKVPGGQCWDASQFYQPCLDEDYETVERQVKVQEARAAGAIIPEYTRHATSAIVVYGRVPDDFAPERPPTDAVLEALGAPNTQEVKFRMQKQRAGTLEQVTVKWFHWSDITPGKSNCFDPGHRPDEISLRECEDLSEMSFDHRLPLLKCHYTGQARGLVGDATYWYGTKPTAPASDPANLLKRSSSHPLLQIGEARTWCPASIAEASGIHDRYRTQLAHLGIQAVAPNVALRSERVTRRQAEYEAAHTAERVRKLAGFSLDGSFDFSVFSNFSVNSFGIPRPGSLQAGQCTLKQTDQTRVEFDCKAGKTDYKAVGEISQGQIKVQWAPRLQLTYEVGTCGAQACLEGKDSRQWTIHWISKKDESELTLEAAADIIARFPLEGTYDLELSLQDKTETLRCTIRRGIRTRPNDFPISCKASDGKTYEGSGRAREYRAPLVISFSWLVDSYTRRKVFTVNNTAIVLQIPVTSSGQANTDFRVKAESGVLARLSRTAPREP